MRNIYIFFAAIVALVAVSTGELAAQSYSVPKATKSLGSMSPDELWNSGNTAYANDQFVDAESYYTEIIERGLYSTELYYNLGNVYHKRGEVGRSLLYYYKALQLSPSDRDILHNIEIAEAKTTDKIERIPTLFITEWMVQIGALMGCMGWSITSLVMLLILLGSIALYILAEQLKLRRIGFFSLLIFASLFIVTTRYALLARQEILNPQEAIVMSRSMSVKSSPSAAATELFIIHEGTKVRIITSHENWSEVKLSDGKRGWVESSRIEQI